MIKNKSDLKRYLEMDRYALGRGGETEMDWRSYLQI